MTRIGDEYADCENLDTLTTVRLLMNCRYVEVLFAKFVKFSMSAQANHVEKSQIDVDSEQNFLGTLQKLFSIPCISF